MKIKSLTISKTLKVPLKQYSTLDTHATLTFDMEEGESPNWDMAWDTLNQQIAQQTGHLEPTWLSKNETLKDFYKLTLKVPKNGQ
jgi:hypothetical protein